MAHQAARKSPQQWHVEFAQILRMRKRGRGNLGEPRKQAGIVRRQSQDESRGFAIRAPCMVLTMQLGQPVAEGHERRREVAHRILRFRVRQSAANRHRLFGRRKRVRIPSHPTEPDAGVVERLGEIGFGALLVGAREVAVHGDRARRRRHGFGCPAAVAEKSGEREVRASEIEARFSRASVGQWVRIRIASHKNRVASAASPPARPSQRPRSQRALAS